LGQDGAMVGTVEHLLSAFGGLGIDNALVELDGTEVPIMDGSAAPFVALIKAAGIRMQRRRRRFLVIKEPISVKDGEKEAALLPFGGFRVSYTIEFDHPLLSNQTYLLDFAQEIYEREIGPARTFGFLDEVEGMRANGLALGGSLENAVVVGAGRILNEEGLRFPDEFVRHKILDALGDLWLLGRPLVGQFRAFKAGHSLNHRLLRKVMAVARSWEVLEFPSRQHWREFMLGRSAAAMA
ncbi:MAG: UDP-3-O-[3-hydroxymyristoyl] N-acetylglucosamine deacetylase, partial [Deltaproteobacteria bacterium]|nr:UDP-3-O-[3-hydroxymyristoyl] N-acetylglucosamine deacetylase [Deltaproteobacteria bacterium]